MKIDGIDLEDGDRVLVMGQTPPRRPNWFQRLFLRRKPEPEAEGVYEVRAPKR